MKWSYFLSLIVILMLTTVVAAQGDVTYETYTSEDGRISFDVPQGWLVTPFGGAFNISTQGWVEATAVQPGQQQVDILTLSAEDLAAGGVAQDLPLEDYTLAVLDTLDDGSSSEPITIEGTRVITLDSGVEAGVVDVSTGSAQAFATVFQQNDVTVFVSSLAHLDEFESFEPIALHIINSIELGENAGQSPDLPPNPVVSVSATDDEILLPPAPEDGVPAGLYTFEIANNRTQAPYSPIIARLNEGVTMDDFNEALATDDGFGAVALVTLLGGSVAVPDQHVSMTVELTPGEYMFMELSQEGPGDIMPFTVVENDTTEDIAVPQADITLTMVDFAFGIPDTIPSGELRWNIENAGEQWHEAAVFSVPEGTTVEEILNSYESGEEGNNEEFGQVYTWLPMSAGAQAWTTIDLEPGTYAILCFLPDLTGNFSPHIAHGMVQVFTVE